MNTELILLILALLVIFVVVPYLVFKSGSKKQHVDDQIKPEDEGSESSLTIEKDESETVVREDVTDDEDIVDFETSLSTIDLTEVKGIGPATDDKLRKRYSSVEDILEADEEELLEILSEARKERLIDFLEDVISNE